MLYFSNPLKQSAISSIFLTIMTGVSSRLQDRFEVVQYQQTMVIAHILDEQGYLVVYLPWQIELLLIRDKADTLPQFDSDALLPGALARRIPRRVRKG